ncbi:flagellar hook-length control protein FliK [Cohnella nanjingensis]|uniref:Flagellar hook-length control protein FliK n=1 Tax=Cohnella nanjingensis TaxID=1387779 RepID=A0A7X0RVT0_9BACL|nr:flagellar hook-length control protein FliK [Cohnella nanjingensis]MBB6674598.1 flagellar hook-length control protein FliK [Cohnella nanjingensis]
MNIPVLSASSGAPAAASPGGKTAGGNGAGFASALVQAIGGSGNAASGGASPSFGLLGLIGTIGQAAPEGDGANPADSLMALLANLAADAQQLQEDGKDLPQDLLAQLAELLTGLQTLLVQGNPVPSGNVATETTPDETPSEDVAQASPLPGTGGKAILASLQQSLQQAMTLTSEANVPTDRLADLAKQLQQAFAQANPKAEAPANPAAAQTGALRTETEAASAQPVAAAVVQGEPKRTTNAFREPVLHWNLNAADASANAGDSAEVGAVQPGEASGDNSATLSWTLTGSEAAGKADGASAKAALPAQVPVQQFAEHVEKYLVKQFSLSSGNGTSEARLSLTPEHLGQVEIRLVMQNGQLNAHFVAHNEAARELLETQLAQLRTTLQGQGIQVERMEVVQQPSLTETSAFLNQEQRRSHSGDRRDSRGGQGGGGNGADEAVAFETELERTASLRDAGYGNALNVTA